MQSYRLISARLRSAGWRKASTALVVAVLLTGCAVNPVTGQREITLVSTAQEISIGQEQYRPAQQMQGGSYQTEPELSAYVNRVGQKVAAFSGIDLPYEFVVLNNSVPNAWALPGGKIAINRGLLVALKSEAELAAVLGHEVAHAAARHGAKRIERGYLTQGLLIGAAIGASGSEYGGQILQNAQLAAGLVNQKYSRDAEREADFYGTHFMAKAGYDPYGAVTLQETFVRLSGAKEPDWINGLFASHPASTERVANNKGLVRRLRDEGFNKGVFGEQEFQRAMAKLKEAAPAYAAFDEATAAYAENDLGTALQQVNRALSLYDKEGQFHGLRGAIRLKQKRYGDAVTNFDRALARDSGYFAYYLNRGLAHAQNKARGAAKSDLNQSVRLLPTATAYRALGNIAEQEGDTQAATRYYAQAGQGQGSDSQAARASLVRLELPRQPAKYLQTRVGRDESNRWLLQVSNRADVAVRDIVVRVEFNTPNGAHSTTARVERLPAGGKTVVNLQVDPQQVTAVQAYPVSGKVAAR